ncbi:ATP-dependent DNA helicase PIF1-like [Dermacentor silvarum]|uniref:ATP-dependent DNA helicase PIF1-like n=1 Tax=Dermacentor silvarum TaxID=543639 RepID=UPI0018996B97|nr:ATP-dependent DNA helicase PIF1-like [Dermacentor silvarum]
MTDRLMDANDDSYILGEGTAVQQAQAESAQAAAARCPAVQMRTDVMPTNVYLQLMRMMNSAQFEIQREVVRRLTTPDSKPLQVFFTGAAGCGKSFLLRTIMDAYNRYCRSANQDVTGHFRDLCDHRQSSRCNRGRSSNDANSFRCIFKDVKCTIIDEISMLSADTLVLIDRQLHTISLKCTKPFGGFDVILCGDLRQLPPIRAAEVYRQPKLHQNVFDTECTPWHNLSYFQLKDVLRQSDKRLSSMLDKIGDGRGLAPDEVSLLESRFVTTEEAAQKCPSGVRLFFTNKEADAFNIAIAEACTEYAIHCSAVDTIFGYRSDEEYAHAKARVANMSKVHMANLPLKVQLCVCKPYMYIRNIDVSDSLISGSVGIL